MRHYRCKEEEIALHGYTDHIIVTHEDLTETTNDTDQTLALLDLAQNDLIYGQPVADVRTQFGGITAVNFTLGYTGTPAYFISSSDAKTARAYIGNVAPVRLDPGDQLLLVFDPAANGEALASVTAGEMHIWAKIWRENLRAPIIG